MGFRFLIIGKLTNTQKLTLKSNNITVCDLPISALSHEAPGMTENGINQFLKRKLIMKIKLVIITFKI